MSAHLLAGDSVLKLSSARIAGEDVREVRDATILLEQAKAAYDTAEAAVQNAQREGYQTGQAEAFEEMQSALQSALSDLSQSFNAENARREDMVASAAMAVVEKLIGATPGEDVIRGLATSALADCGASSGNVTVCVAPEWAEELTQASWTDRSVTVVADPALDRFGCRVESGEGRIVADLNTQMESLRARWGLASQADQVEGAQNG